MQKNKLNMSVVKVFVMFLFMPLFVITKIFAETNPGFESGLAGWTISGDPGNFKIDTGNAFEGTSCVKIIGRNSGIWQRVEALPYSIIQFKAYLKSSNQTVSGYSCIRFYNDSNQLLLEYKSKPLSFVEYESTGNYTLAPPNTKYFSIGIEKDSSAGYIYMRPFWNYDTIFN